MSDQLDYGKMRKTYLKHLENRKTVMPASVAQKASINFKAARKSYVGRKSLRHARALMNEHNDGLREVVTTAEAARLQATLAEFAWVETP